MEGSHILFQHSRPHKNALKKKKGILSYVQQIKMAVIGCSVTSEAWVLRSHYVTFIPSHMENFSECFAETSIRLTKMEAEIHFRHLSLGVLR